MDEGDDATETPSDVGGGNVIEINSKSTRKTKMTAGTTEKLCGYLSKLGSRGLLKSFKKRWFVFSENNCKLYYYRSPEDILPLGEIDVAKATFSFEVTNVERPGLFCISTPEKSYDLEAPDRQTCLFWLQELQKRRKDFSRKRTSQILSNTKLNRVQSVGKLESGLLRRPSAPDAIPDDPAIFTHVDCPKGMVGEGAAERHPTSRSWSFTKLRDQVVQTVSNRRQLQRRSNESSTESRSGRSSAESCSGDYLIPCEPSGGPSGGPSEEPASRRFQWRFSNSFRMKDASRFTPGPCKKCDQYVEQVASLKDDVLAMDDELDACHEVIKVLRNQIDYLSQQRDSLVQKTSLDSDGQELLNQKDVEIVTLKQQLDAKGGTMTALEGQLRCVQTDLATVKEQLALYQETIQVKDDVVVQLTNQISLLEEPPQQDDGSETGGTSYSPSRPDNHRISTSVSEENDADTLRDSLQAYTLQNRFLNKEILELNHLRTESESRENKLLICCSEWEAKYYQVQSKYLLLLNDLHVPRVGRKYIFNSNGLKNGIIIFCAT